MSTGIGSGAAAPIGFNALVATIRHPQLTLWPTSSLASAKTPTSPSAR
jgi:hypothetical protein